MIYLDLLKRRYVRGDIDIETFEQQVERELLHEDEPDDVMPIFTSMMKQMYDVPTTTEETRDV